MAVDEQIEERSAPGERSFEELAILTVRDTILFPHAMLPITVGRPSSVALVESLGENRLLGVVAQLDARVETPAPEDLYRVGTVALLHKAVRVQKDNLLLFCEGVARIRVPRLVCTLLYGSGLRLLEGLQLRVRTSTSAGAKSRFATARARKIV